ncbi:CDP-alcohol phosphatidyltransferase family protein [Photobacterium sp. WH77]|uniref:CDP-alcohol phosphatidyltransferase family protein n=1 Tax=Photobacterium arenosum TaxID=2774143 RepID=A0ABR9BNH3_9GAMM|nr:MULTISPECIES: CDP-alcohol phosphatidyltransferase family protein [Photobacterium]MBD8514123.1 CDP-alcohol phosphatidyltransferase family protein [Photobacterium arenosum]MCG2839014.1 CDP-alcohol phosphatidyltransferase family protein [Photobacterium sp. WH77]MCG2846634.1 CDP-alcohol phosphatidyltransferase family protein [Photobacterium sp. WH80]
MKNQHEPESNRRPLAVREKALTKHIAVWLSQKNITPNQISLMSIVFAIIGLATLLWYKASAFTTLLLVAAACIQLRLLCNLFDGMVAVEGGKKTPAGELFNDVPDRIADSLLILAAGFATQSDIGMTLAWLCALVAVLTAYVRVLGVSMGCPADFRGPMAKQHRMALLTVSFLVLFVSQVFALLPEVLAYTLDAALTIMLIGSVMTTWRRLAGIYRFKAAQQAGKESADNE